MERAREGAAEVQRARLTLTLTLTLGLTLTLSLGLTLTLTLTRYNALVSARSSTIDEVAELQQQNGELKALLNQYLSSKINEDLHVPPTQVIQLDNYESFQ